MDIKESKRKKSEATVSDKSEEKSSVSKRTKYYSWIGWIAAAILLLFLSWKLIEGPGIIGPAAGEEFRGNTRETTESLSSQEATEASVPQETKAPDPKSDQPQTGELLHILLEPVLNVSGSMKDSLAFRLAPPPVSERKPEQSVTILALGDNLMHNTVMWSGQTGYGYDFRPLYRFIKEDVQAADIACIDQETIFINDPKEFTNYPSFGGPVQIGEALIDAGFDVILHATNHCYDKFGAGIRDTLNFWHQHPEITVLGIHDSQEDADRIRVVERNGIRIAMLNYTYGTNAGGVEADWMIDYLNDEEKIADDILRAKEISDFVVVFPHWGSENTFEPDDFQQKWARFFADHGVGAVIGGHTHTLQPVEIVRGAEGNEMPVFWSLGNFISDMATNWNMLGGMALLTVSRDKYGVFVSDYSLVPTMTYDSHSGGVWQFFGMRLSEYNDVLAASHRRPNTSVKEMWDLYRSIIPEAAQAQ